MDESRQILDAIDRWLKRDVEPKAAKLEHDDVWPQEMVEQMRSFVERRPISVTATSTRNPRRERRA